MARLPIEVGTKNHFSRHEFSLNKCSPKFSPKILSLYFVGPKNPAKFPPDFPPKSQKNTDELLQERREKKPPSYTPSSKGPLMLKFFVCLVCALSTRLEFQLHVLTLIEGQGK